MKLYDVSGTLVGGKDNGKVKTVRVLAYNEGHAETEGAIALKNNHRVDTVHVYRVDEIEIGGEG